MDAPMDAQAVALLLLKKWRETPNETKFSHEFSKLVPQLHRLAHPEEYENVESAGTASDKQPEAADQQATVSVQPERATSVIEGEGYKPQPR